MKRRWLIAVLVAALAPVACSRLYIRAAAGDGRVADGDPMSTVFLIGDFGRPSPPLEDLVSSIRRDVERATAGSPRTAPVILELGDNLYEDGLPHDLGAPGAESAVDTLRSIAAQFARIRDRGRQVPLMLIPGNHDYSDNALVMGRNLGDISRWYFLDELGIEGADAWTHLPGDAARFGSAAELFEQLDGDPAAHAEFMAPVAVPGLDDGLRVIAVDSELILDLYAQGHESLAVTYWQSLERTLIEVPDDAWLMVATHHPPVTYGKHGHPALGNWVFGQGWPQFPRTRQKALALSATLGVVLGIVAHPVAIAVVGVPPLTTALLARRKQDVGSGPYDRYAAELLRLAQQHDVDVILAGHDHNTQIIELSSIEGFAGDSLLVISGAGSKVDPVRRGPGTVAYLSDYSYVRLTQYAEGLAFEIIDRRGGSRYRYNLLR